MAFLPNLRRAVTGRPVAGKAAAPYALQSYYTALSEHYGRLTRDWPIERAVTEGYDRVIWVFKSVNTIGQDQSRLPFVLREGAGEDAEVIEDHPLARLLNKKANQLETGQVFRKRLSAQILLSKRGAFVEVTKSNRGTPIRLDLLPPDRVEIVPGRDSLVDHFRLTLRTGGYRNIDPEKVRWFRDPHPIDPYSGVTPLESMGMSVELDHFARLYNVTFMSNDGRPGGVLAVRDTKGTSGDIDPRIMDRIEQRFGKGPQEAGKLSVIAGELSYVDTAANPRDSQYTEASRNSKIEILSGFGIGESVLGYAAERTFDNADNELYVYWTRTMPGHLDIISTGFDEDSEDNITGGFDTSGVEVLERAARERRKEAREEVAAGLRSIFDYAKIADIDTIESTPHTRALYVPSGKTPLPARAADAAALGMAQPEETPGPGAGPEGAPALPPGQDEPAALPGPPAPGPPPGPTADETPAALPAPGAARAALDAVAGRKSGLRLIEGGRPKALTSSAQRKDSDQAESVLDLDAVAVLEESLTHVLTALTGRWLERTEARLTSPKQRKNTRHWTPEYDHDTRIGTKALDAARAVDAETWEEEAQEQTHPVLTAAAIAAAAAILADLHVVPPVGSTLVDMARRIVLLGVEQVVSSIARAAGAQAVVIADDLNRADQEGEDFDAILHRLHEHRDRLAGWARRLAGWAAYAGTNGARDDGAREANRDESIEIARAWFTRRDDKVRPSHHAADGQVRGLDEPFVVGGSLLRFPGDPLAPIGETANCRCWLRYRSKRTGRWVPTPDTKALRPRDGDGDGFVEDGTPRMRPVPVRAALPHEDAVAAGAARVARHRAEARRYDGPQVADFDWQTARDTLGQVYATTFNTSTGRRVTSVGAVHVDVVEDDDGDVAGYAIYGELSDLDTDQTVGVFDRFIGRDGTAFHNGFTVEAQGEGIASEFNAHAVAWYRQIGVDRIGVNATGTMHQTTRPPENRPGQAPNPVSEAISRSVRRAYNGGYTWGQQGFVFADDAFDNTLIGRVWAFRDPAASVLRGVATDEVAEIVAPALRNLLGNALPDDWWDDDVQRAILADLLDSIDPESITPYELNGVGRGMPFVDRDTGEDTWLGRALMSRSSWLGYFDLWWLDIYPETKARGLDATRRRMLVDLFLAALGDDADTMEGKSRRGYREPRDGDGDGFIYDSTPRMRRVTPLSGARWRRAVEAARATEPRPAAADRDGTAVAASRPDPDPAPVLSAVPQSAVLDAFTIANRVNADRIAQGGGDPGILDRLIRAAEAYDVAVHLGEGVAAALSRLLDVLQRIADLRTPGGRYLLDQDDLGDGYRRLSGLSYSDTLPEAKAVYSGGVGEKTLHRGTTPRDGDGDGFIDDGKPTQRPAPNRLAQVAAAASRAGTAAAAAARRTPEPTTSWRRAIGGYMHPTGDYFLERQAPMAGGRTNWWAIHQRVPPERVGRDRPDSTIAYDTENGQVLTQIDGVDWYAHVGDEGSLADAKYAVDRLRGVPEPGTDHRGEGYRQARDRFGNASREDRERVLGKVEQMLPTAEGTQRESMEGIRDFLADSLEADAPPTVPDEADDLGSVHVGPGRVDGTGTADDPIDVQGDLTRAARLIAEGKHVRLNRVDEIGTLVEKLAALVREAADRGEKAPTYDLCKVSVPGTNLFCKQSKGIPRLQMPQLSGKPLPGSKSDALPRNPRGNVNIKDLFVEAVQARGITVEHTTMPAAAMKATQNELDGPSVGRIYTTFRGGGRAGSGTLVTRDGYILDGHHQWAAQIAVDADNGLLGDQMVDVRMVDLEIGEAIETARAFSTAYGITPSGIGADDTARAPEVDIGAYFIGGVTDATRGPWRADNVFVGTDRDAWVRGGMPVEPIPLTGLRSTQTRLYPETMEAYRADPDREPIGGALPMVVEYEGDRYVIDGHHRIAEAIERGQQQMDVMLHRVDKPTAPTRADGDVIAARVVEHPGAGARVVETVRTPDGDVEQVAWRIARAGAGRDWGVYAPEHEHPTPDTPRAHTALTRDDATAWALAETRAKIADRNPDFGKRVGAPVKRPMPGGGFVLVEKIGTRTPGQTIERVIWRVERRDGVWGVYPPPEQSPAVFMTGSKREAERWAVEHDDGKVPEDD